MCHNFQTRLFFINKITYIYEIIILTKLLVILKNNY